MESSRKLLKAPERKCPGLVSAAILISFAFLCSASLSFAQKLGLSSSFGNVTLQNLKPGTAYPLKKLKGHGYSLTNLSEVAVDLVMNVVPPLKGSLKPYYEAIRDPKWVKVSPNRVHLEPGAAGEGEVTIRVSKEEVWKDRNFQCALYAHTLQGSFINVGIYDKIFFSTGGGPDAMKAKGPHLDWLPGVLPLGKVPPAKPFESVSRRVRLELRNATEAKQTVRVEAVPFGTQARPPIGFGRAPDPGALRFSGGPLEVGAGETVEVPFRLELAKESAGRRLAFRVRAATQEPAMEAYGVVLVEASGRATPSSEGAKKK